MLARSKADIKPATTLTNSQACKSRASLSIYSELNYYASPDQTLIISR